MTLFTATNNSNTEGSRQRITSGDALRETARQQAIDVVALMTSNPEEYKPLLDGCFKDTDVQQKIIAMANYDAMPETLTGISESDIERLYKSFASAKSHTSKKALTESTFMAWLQASIALKAIIDSKGGSGKSRRGRKAINLESVEHALEVHKTVASIESRKRSLLSMRSKLKAAGQDLSTVEQQTITEQVQYLDEAMVTRAAEQELEDAKLAELKETDITKMNKTELQEYIERMKQAL